MQLAVARVTNLFHMAGNDPHLVAQEAVRLMKSSEDNRRDADHPTEDDEG